MLDLPEPLCNLQMYKGCWENLIWAYWNLAESIDSSSVQRDMGFMLH